MFCTRMLRANFAAKFVAEEEHLLATQLQQPDINLLTVRVGSLESRVTEVMRTVENLPFQANKQPIVPPPDADVGNTNATASTTKPAAAVTSTASAKPTLRVNDSLDRMRMALDKGVSTGQLSQVKELAQGNRWCVLLPHQLAELYEFSAKQPKKPWKLTDLMMVTTPEALFAYGQRARRQMPIHIARSAEELTRLPFGLSHCDSIRTLRLIHELSYLDCMDLPIPKDTVSAIELCRRLEAIHIRHHLTTNLLSEGLREFVIRNQLENDTSIYDTYSKIQQDMHVIATNRIKIRFAIAHYIRSARQLLPKEAWAATAPTAWTKNISSSTLRRDELANSKREMNTFGLNEDAFVGSVCHEMNMSKVVEHAVEYAKQEMQSGRLPPIHVSTIGDPNFTFTYVPQQCFNIVSSLVSHAIKITKWRHRTGKNIPLTPIEVRIFQKSDAKDCIVQVEDTAGGLPLDMVHASQTYLYSAHRTEWLKAAVSQQQQQQQGSSGAGQSANMPAWMKSALRVPYATTAAQCFGGDISTVSIDGVGTSVCYHAPLTGLDLLSF